MSKLLYAATKAAFTTNWTDWASTSSSIYRSVGFTTDGYLYTHGKFFRIFDATTVFTAARSNNTVTLSDVNGTSIVSFDIGISALAAGSTATIITTSTDANGIATVSHATSSLGASTLGATVASADSIVVPKVVTDAYGHLITGTTQYTATLNQVRTNGITTAANYYLTFAASSSTGTSELNKVSTVYVNPSTGALYAASLYQGGTAISGIYAPIAHANSATTYGIGTSTLYGHVKLSDSYSSTSGQDSGVAASSLGLKNAYDAAIAYANGLLAANDAMIFKGTLGTGGTVTALPTTYDVGWTYRVITAGTYAGNVCEVGDLIIALIDRTGTGNANTDWTVVQTNIDGAVTTTGLTANQLVLGNSTSTSVKTLAAGTNGQVLKMVGGIPAWATDIDTWRAVKVNGVEQLSASVSTALDIANGAGISVSYTGGQVVIANTGILSSDVFALTINNSGTSVGTYNPVTAARSINVTNGLTASFSDPTFTIGHTNSVPAQGSTAVRSFTYDAHGHITGSSVVTALQNPNALTFFANDGTTALATYDGSAARSFRFVNGTDITMTPSFAGSQMTYTLGVTQRYRPINYYPTAGGTSTAIYTNSDGSALTFKPGNTNVTMSYSGGVLSISSVDTNTWRNVSAYLLTNNTLSEVLSTSIGGVDLQFGDEFLWDGTNNELKMGWAEVNAGGVVTYAV